jgi:hypothetical protein
MNIVLEDSMHLPDVYEVFSKLFPFLKIEFFEKRSSGAVLRRFANEAQKTLKEFKYPYANGRKLVISPNTTVQELDKMFTETYALQLQVFRKSGNIWLETTVTDNWTLEEQNEQGEAITAQMNRNKV